jgi:hypothetical protein
MGFRFDCLFTPSRQLSPNILYLFTCVGLGYGQFTGRIALPIWSFFLEVSTIVDYDNSHDRLLRSSRLWQGGTLCFLVTSTLIKRLKAPTEDEKGEDWNEKGRSSASRLQVKCESALKGVSRCVEPEPACSPAGPSVHPLQSLHL